MFRPHIVYILVLSTVKRMAHISLTLCIHNLASWRNRLVARFPSVVSRVRVSVTLYGLFLGGQNMVWVRFSPGFSRFPLPKIPFHYLSTFISFIRFISFYQSLWWCDRPGQPAFVVLTDLKWRGFIATHPSTRPCVGHELRIFIIYCISQGCSLSPTLFNIYLEDLMKNCFPNSGCKHRRKKNQVHKICRWYGFASRRLKDAEERADGDKLKMWGLWDEDKYK